MTTSGLTNFNLDLSEITEEAFERCGAEMRSGYDLRTARRSLNLLTIEWANKGINLWTIEQGQIPMNQGQIASQPIAVEGWLYVGTMGGALVAFDADERDKREFVLASRALGATHAQILFRHILPNVTGIISDTRAISVLLHRYGALSFWVKSAAVATWRTRPISRPMAISLNRASSQLPLNGCAVGQACWGSTSRAIDRASTIRTRALPAWWAALFSASASVSARKPCLRTR